MLFAMICFAIDTGLRSEEQLNCRWTEIDLENNQVTVPDERAKSGVGRVVPLLPRTVKLLKALPRQRHSRYVFWCRAGQRYFGAYQQFVRTARKIGITDLRWHDLRRTCGCRLLQLYELPMERVSAWLGHSSVKVTEDVYAFLDVRHLHASIRHATAQITSHDKTRLTDSQRKLLAMQGETNDTE